MSETPEVIRDPVHNLISLSGKEGEMIAELIDRPEFQRLRRIRQLGLGFLAYPGAEHSRWIHSLGVYHVARRMMDALKARYGENSEEYQELNEHRKAILAAALLHDIGHGPFSHVFERAMRQPQNPQADYPENHEGWSIHIIRDRLSEILRGHDVDVEIVAGLIDKKNRHHLLAKDFISSQLDADRIDYLLRDSLATGTKYGDFDLDWLLHSLRIGKVGARGQPTGVQRLCFNLKAIHVIEEYIQAREFMYTQVYVHKTTRAYEAALENILGLAASIADGEISQVPSPCPDALRKMLAGQAVETEEYLSLDDFRLWCTFTDWSRLDNASDAHIRRLAVMCRKLINREQPYKAIELDRRQKQDDALALVTDVRNTDLEFSCRRDAFVDLAYRNVLFRKRKESEEQEDRAIFFVDSGGRTHPLESESKMIFAISGLETTIYRLYYDESDSGLVNRLRAEGWLPDSENSSESEERS